MKSMKTLNTQVFPFSLRGEQHIDLPAQCGEVFMNCPWIVYLINHQ